MNFYKIENGQLQVGSGSIIPDGFIEYEDDTKPQELVDALVIQEQAQVKQQAFADAKAEYEASIQAIIGQTPMTEIATWDKQETEARAILADETAVTPLINALVTARNLGETRVELATKIVANADAYAVATGQLLGQYQNKLKAISA